jgi:hypothetical protein
LDRIDRTMQLSSAALIVTLNHARTVKECCFFHWQTIFDEDFVGFGAKVSFRKASTHERHCNK